MPFASDPCGRRRTRGRGPGEPNTAFDSNSNAFERRSKALLSRSRGSRHFGTAQQKDSPLPRPSMSWKPEWGHQWGAERLFVVYTGSAEDTDCAGDYEWGLESANAKGQAFWNLFSPKCFACEHVRSRPSSRPPYENLTPSVRRTAWTCAR